MTVECECVRCKNIVLVKVRGRDLQRWSAGELTQKCFPYLSASEREMFISGICEKCWAEIFGEDD